MALSTQEADIDSKILRKWEEDKTFSPNKPTQSLGPRPVGDEGATVSSDKWLIGPVALGQAIVTQEIMRVATA